MSSWLWYTLNGHNQECSEAKTLALRSLLDFLYKLAETILLLYQLFG